MELIVHVLACLAEGLGIRATARVFEVDPNTVLHWLVEVASPVRAFCMVLPRNRSSRSWRRVAAEQYCSWRRLNLDIRQRVAAVGRRVNTLCQGEDERATSTGDVPDLSQLLSCPTPRLRSLGGVAGPTNGGGSATTVAAVYTGDGR